MRGCISLMSSASCESRIVHIHVVEVVNLSSGSAEDLIGDNDALTYITKGERTLLRPCIVEVVVQDFRLRDRKKSPCWMTCANSGVLRLFKSNPNDRSVFQRQHWRHESIVKV